VRERSRVWENVGDGGALREIMEHIDSYAA
jgi:hypothetical protein